MPIHGSDYFECRRVDACIAVSLEHLFGSHDVKVVYNMQQKNRYVAISRTDVVKEAGWGFGNSEYEFRFVARLSS